MKTEYFDTELSSVQRDPAYQKLFKNGVRSRDGSFLRSAQKTTVTWEKGGKKGFKTRRITGHGIE